MDKSLDQNLLIFQQVKVNIVGHDKIFQYILENVSITTSSIQT